MFKLIIKVCERWCDVLSAYRLTLAGFLKSVLGVSFSYLYAICVNSLVALLLPVKDDRCCFPSCRYNGNTEENSEEKNKPDQAASVNNIVSSKIFLPMSWVLNFATLATTTTIINQYMYRKTNLFYSHFSKLVKARKIQLPFEIGSVDPQEAFFGTFLCCVYLAQSGIFLVFGFTEKWQYRRWLMYLVQLAMIASCVAISFLSQSLLLLGVAVVIGCAAGFAYQSSLAYSLLRSAEHKGKVCVCGIKSLIFQFLGVHEAIIGSSAAIFPLLSGLLASLLDELRVPYWVCACVQLCALCIEETIFRIGTSAWWAHVHFSTPKVPWTQMEEAISSEL